MAITSTFLLLLSSSLGLLSIARGCSPPEGGFRTPTLEYKMMNSDVVAYGLVTRRIPDNRHPQGRVYSVDFELRCIFKGAPLNERIRINDVGSVPGLCISTNLTEGEKYLVYLRKVNNEYVPEYRQDPGEPQYVDEVTVLCEATVSYPNGYDENNNKETCPEEYLYDDCVQRPVITTPGPTQRPPTPPSNGGQEPPMPPNNGDKEPPMPPNNQGEEPPLPNDSTNHQPSDQHESDVPYKPVVENKVDDDNSAVTLTSHLGILVCLVFSVFML